MSRSVRGPDYEALRESQARDQECLTIYPKHPDADAYRVGAAFEPYAIVATDKRFRTAELAAEVHKASADFLSAHMMSEIFEDDETKAALDRKRELMFKIEDFANLPHFDD